MKKEETLQTYRSSYCIFYSIEQFSISLLICFSAQSFRLVYIEGVSINNNSNRELES